MGLRTKMYNQNQLYKNQFDSRWWCQPWGVIHCFLSNKLKILKINKITKLLLQLISIRFYSNFKREHSLDTKFYSPSKEYPCHIILMDLSTRKMRKTWKMWLQSQFFYVFLIFNVVGPIESMQHGYSLDEELKFSSKEYSHSKFE